MSNRFTLHHGDCIEVMRSMPDCSVDSVVTDPPYELGFMGKNWDASGIAFNTEVWREALRVLKPGGHLLAFSGSRTYHRMAVAIEDAGFEIRDQIMWLYGQGFPKSLNVSKDDLLCQCDQIEYSYEEAAEPHTEHGLPSVRQSDVPTSMGTKPRQGSVLLTGMQEQSSPIAGRTELATTKDGFRESGLEGRSDLQEAEGELRRSEVRSLPERIANDGTQGRLHHGASLSHGDVDRSSLAENGSGQSHQPQSARQQAGKLGVVSNERGSQTWRGWSLCSRCSKPIVPRGLGTALKPAHEPIVVARKPLSGTVAANVLAHGVGALNIDGCRVGTEIITQHQVMSTSGDPADGAGGQRVNVPQKANGVVTQTQGRWPANVIHDGSDEVVALFPDTGKSGVAVKRNRDGSERDATLYDGGYKKLTEDVGYLDSGSAARFFYCAKANKKDRNEGLDGFAEKRASGYGYDHGLGAAAEGMFKDRNPIKKNHHPTVKPTDLMRYLIRLVTPQGATILDPFMGSGSTGKAAMYEGVNFIGIEQDADYLAIAQARIQFALNKPLEDQLFERTPPSDEELANQLALPLTNEETA